MDPRKSGYNLSVKTAQDLISRMDDQRSKVFKFGSQWVHVVPRENLGLKLVDQQLRISISLRVEANICVAHTCLCGKRVERGGLNGLSCTKCAGRFSHHATQYSHNADIGISRIAFNARTAWIVPNSQTVLP